MECTVTTRVFGVGDAARETITRRALTLGFHVI